LLSLPLSIYARQVALLEEPFTFQIQTMASVFCMRYVVMIAQRTLVGQFAWVDVKDDISSKNYVNYSSISRCVNEKANSFRMLYLVAEKYVVHQLIYP
jgi:hypothetical protein